MLLEYMSISIYQVRKKEIVKKENYANFNYSTIKLSHNPFAVFANVFASSGAITNISAQSLYFSNIAIDVRY